jgi:hypothetical protein
MINDHSRGNNSARVRVASYTDTPILHCPVKANMTVLLVSVCDQTKKMFFDIINRKLRVATKIGSTFFWFLLLPGSCKMIIYHQHGISDRQNTIMLDI